MHLPEGSSTFDETSSTKQPWLALLHPQRSEMKRDSTAGRQPSPIGCVRYSVLGPFEEPFVLKQVLHKRVHVQHPV